MLCKTLEHRFVKHIPEVLEAGVLYVSMQYGSAAHACCCGCGEEVVTPLTPTDWKLIFDGETVSLRPSIGSWSLPCRSHYIIDRNRVLVAESWNKARIDAGRRRDQTAKKEHYKQMERAATSPSTRSIDKSVTQDKRSRSWWRRLFS